ncbi:hypothetical protein BJY00DRAFT_314839 [Aspergillus carlsbadensis]|nr:hypothetical protein BJY00DRAFT_314839 [Aspergillus carlsbadensis]
MAWGCRDKPSERSPRYRFNTLDYFATTAHQGNVHSAKIDGGDLNDDVVYCRAGPGLCRRQPWKGGFYSERRGLNYHGTKRCTPCNVEPAWTQAAAREGPVMNPALPQSLKGLNVFGDTCSYTEDSDATMKVQGTLKCEKWKDAVCGKGPDMNYACGNGVWAAYMLVCQWPGNYFEHLDN